MNKKSNTTKALLNYLKEKVVVTTNELKEFLSTSSRMTVFRKITKLEYISSCSHKGKYYCLKKSARFNKYGLWSYKSVLFSKHGTLKKTLIFLINDSEKGYTAPELHKILKVKVDDALYQLVKKKIIIRKKMSGVYVYYAKASQLSKKQELFRKDRLECQDRINMNPKILANELKAALIIFFSILDEKQRRLYAGLESLKTGHSGDKQIAELLDLNEKTVAKGRTELLSGKVKVETIRSPGGGRKKIEKKFQM